MGLGEGMGIEKSEGEEEGDLLFPQPCGYISLGQLYHCCDLVALDPLCHHLLKVGDELLKYHEVYLCPQRHSRHEIDAHMSVYCSMLAVRR